MDELRSKPVDLPAVPGLSLLADSPGEFAFRIDCGQLPAVRRSVIIRIVGGCLLILLWVMGAGLLLWEYSLPGETAAHLTLLWSPTPDEAMVYLTFLWLPIGLIAILRGVAWITRREGVEATAQQVVFTARSVFGSSRRTYAGANVSAICKQRPDPPIGTKSYEVHLAASGVERVRFGRYLDREVLVDLAGRIDAVAGRGRADVEPPDMGLPDGLNVERLDDGFRLELPRPRYDWMTIGLWGVALVPAMTLLFIPVMRSVNPLFSTAFFGSLLGVGGVAVIARSVLLRHFVDVCEGRISLCRRLGTFHEKAVHIPLGSIENVLAESRDKSRDRQLHVLTLETSRGDFAVGRGLTAEQAKWLSEKIQERMETYTRQHEVPRSRR
jgi:hypothetical protein